MIQLFVSLLLNLAAPAPERCAPADLACTARVTAREAREATDPQERAEARLTAARAHLGLYRKTGARSHLCQARRFVVGLRRTQGLGDLLPMTRKEIEAELTRLGALCPDGARRPKPRASASASSSTTEDPAPVEVAPLLVSQAGRPDEREHVESPPAREPNTEPAPAGGRTDDLLPVDPDASPGATITRPGPSARPVLSPTDVQVGPSAAQSNPPRGPDAVGPPEGRGLLIAGGVLVGGASIVGGLAGFASVRAGDFASQQNALAAETHEQGFSTPDMSADSKTFAAGVAQWQRVMIATSITCAALGSAAVGLITAGAVKRRRAARVAVSLGFPGLLLHARF